MLKYLLLLLSITCLAQTNDLVLGAGSDTTFVSYKKSDEVLFNLHPIDDNKNEYSFRFSYWGYVVTVYKYQGKTFGDVQRYTNEVDNSEKPLSIFKMTFGLTEEQAKKILSLVDSTQIKKLPSDKFIDGWQQGLDGVTYQIEERYDSIYTLKSYWTPNAQNIAEAKIIEGFKEELFKIIDSDKIWKDFDSLIPFDTWSGNGVIISRVYTRKQLRERKRLKKNKS